MARVTTRTLYRVNVSQVRQATFYVLATDEGAAREDADELSGGLSAGDWDEIEDDLSVRECDPATAEASAWLWTGGPDGDNAQVGDFFPEARKDGSSP